MSGDIRFPNWQSRLLLSGVGRRQPILEARLPRPVERLLRWYEARVLKPGAGGAALDRPIFLLGMPRSGTTMLQDILCEHPQVAYLNNTMSRYPTCFCTIEHFRRRLKLDFEADRYLADSVRVSASTPSEGISMWSRWFGVDPYDLSYHPRTLDDFPEPVVRDMHATFRKVVWCHGGGRTRFFNKLLAVMPYVHLVARIFPDARFVHIIRDARQAANSMLKLYRTEVEHQKRTGAGRRDPRNGIRYFISYPRFEGLERYMREFGPDDIRTTAHLWNDEIAYLDGLRGSLPHFHEVRYEDIVESPQREIGRVLEACELPPPDRAACEPFWRRVAEVGVLRHTNRYGDFAAVEAICAENMRRHGYRPG